MLMNVEMKPGPAAAMMDRPVEMQPLEKRRLQSYLAIMLGDIAMLLTAFVAAGYGYLGTDGAHLGLVLGQLLLPVFLTIALYNNAYSLQTLVEPAYGVRQAIVALLRLCCVIARGGFLRGI